MTVSYDPNSHDPNSDDLNSDAYLDEYSVRTEVTRVFDLCLSCRRCLTVCETFTSFFDLVNRKALTEAGLLTPAEQDQMMSLCTRCGLCAHECPYAAREHQGAPSGLAFDISRLAVRHQAMLRHNGLVPWRVGLSEFWNNGLFAKFRRNGHM